MLYHKLLSIVAFLIVANPETYKLTRSILGAWVATPEGTAKTAGLVLHALVFVLVMWLLKTLYKKIA